MHAKSPRLYSAPRKASLLQALQCLSKGGNSPSIWSVCRADSANWQQKVHFTAGCGNAESGAKGSGPGCQGQSDGHAQSSATEGELRAAADSLHLSDPIGSLFCNSAETFLTILHDLRMTGQQAGQRLGMCVQCQEDCLELF